MSFLSLLALLFVPGTASAQTETPQVPIVEESSDEPRIIQPPEWPGYDSLRGLPECPVGTAPPAPGEAYVCRPPWDPTGPKLVFDFTLSTGWADADIPLEHSTVAIRATLGVPVSTGLSIDGSYAYSSAGDAGVDADGDFRDDDDTDNLMLHMPALGVTGRVFTDETNRQAWALSAAGGYAIGKNEHGPFARLSLAREFGALVGTGSVHAKLGLSAAMGFGELEGFYALTADLGFGFSTNVHEPGDLDEPSSGPLFEHSVGLEIVGSTAVADQPSFGGSVGVGLTLSVPVTPWLVGVTRAGFTSYIGREMSTTPIVSADGAYSFEAEAGARLQPWGQGGFSPYLEVMGGYSGVMGTGPLAIEDGPIADFGIGGIVGGCALGTRFGIRYRRGLSSANEELEVVSFVFSIDANSFSQDGMFSDMQCGYYDQPTRANVTVIQPPPPPVVVQQEIEVEIPRVEIEAELEVEIEIEPLVIDIPIGFSAFGGAFQVQLDLSSLPIEQLRNSGFVSVEIVGPAHAVAGARAQIEARLSQNGLRVDAASEVVADVSEIRAIFTIWPTGHRP